MEERRYTIGLRPVTKKNSLRIFRGRNGKPFPVPSEAYAAYEKSAGSYLRPRPAEPIGLPVEVRCLFYMPTRRRVDLTNLLEAADDVLVHWGILADDHSGIVVSHDGSRVLYDKERPRTEIWVRRMP